MPTRNPARELLSVAEFAAELNVHPVTVRRWIARGDIPAVRLPGGTLRLDRRDLDLAARRVRPGEDKP
jgi:putative resolvase